MFWMIEMVQSWIEVSYMYAVWSSVSHPICCQEEADNCDRVESDLLKTFMLIQQLT